MRFSIFAALLLGVAAHPAEKRDTCCCCDVSLESVVCQQKTDCICPGVMCPPSASTIWRDAMVPRATGLGVKLAVAAAADGEGDDDDDEGCDATEGEDGQGFECCCCNPSKPAIVCTNKASAADCFCPAVACPTDAPTVYETAASATATTPVPSATDPGATVAATPDPEPCCCCNIGQGAIVCEMRSSSGGDQGCFCPMVMCPSGAPTVTVWPDEPAATS